MKTQTSDTASLISLETTFVREPDGPEVDPSRAMSFQDLRDKMADRPLSATLADAACLMAGYNPRLPTCEREELGDFVVQLIRRGTAQDKKATVVLRFPNHLVNSLSLEAVKLNMKLEELVYLVLTSWVEFREHSESKKQGLLGRLRGR